MHARCAGRRPGDQHDVLVVRACWGLDVVSADEAVRQEDSRHRQDRLLIGPARVIRLQEK